MSSSFRRERYDCIVIGAGHAGIEAALAASRMKAKTLMLSMSFDTIGEMSCNPAIGGVGKGQLVKEIDALGGEMGRAADATAVQFRQLNASKGQAVRSSRCQSDRVQYKKYMQKRVSTQPGLHFEQAKVSALLVKGSTIEGVQTKDGKNIYAKTVILTPGTFLNGKIHIGSKTFLSGRLHEPHSAGLCENLKDLGFDMMSFKTGTPPRLSGKTINFSKLMRQDSDVQPSPFSFTTQEILKNRKLLPCYITTTNEKTHNIIRRNIHLSPMYSGKIQSTGVRYCPSIEDKLVKFAEKNQHQIFLEPEGLETDLYYPNGISTGLPEHVQEAMVHSIKGLEQAQITQFGYSIEHDVIDSTQLKPSLETKKINGFFCAGQINGTTGYEEAAAQGLIAGINAVLKIRGQEPFVLGRDESYIGVLIDDLITKGTEEPYRMFTSRVENRLIVREDNADWRMCAHAYRLGLIEKEHYEKIRQKYQCIEDEINHLRQVRVRPSCGINEALQKRGSAPLRSVTALSDILKRPGISYDVVAPFNGKFKNFSPTMISQIEYEIKYQGFIERQRKEIDRFRYLERIKLPEGIDYHHVPGLSIEIQQKLQHHTPVSLGQASRISGVTPAAISILMIYLKKRNLAKI